MSDKVKGNPKPQPPKVPGQNSGGGQRTQARGRSALPCAGSHPREAQLRRLLRTEERRRSRATGAAGAREHANARPGAP
jgi:hypothetical protein